MVLLFYPHVTAGLSLGLYPPCDCIAFPPLARGASVLRTFVKLFQFSGILLVGGIKFFIPPAVSQETAFPPLIRGAGDGAVVCKFLSIFLIDVVFICYFVMVLVYLSFSLIRFEVKG